MKLSLLTNTFEQLEQTRSRLQMTTILANLFEKTTPEDAEKIVFLLQGRVSPQFENIEIGMGEKFIEQAISFASGHTKKQIEKSYSELGDLGLVAQKAIQTKTQQSLESRELTVSDVFNGLLKISKSEGQGSQDLKIKLLTELLNSSKSLDAKWIVRIPIGSLRLGVGEPTILDALSVLKKGDKSLREKLERAYNISSDLGQIAKQFIKNGEQALSKFKITPGKPIRVALGERATSPKDIIQRMKTPIIEPKMDGFRQQIHKNQDQVYIFSRKLENMTHMFPDVVNAVRQLPARNIILDSEALGFDEKTNTFLSFQETIKRKRKYGIKEKAQQTPLRVMCFDIMYCNDKDLTSLPFTERRKHLEKQVPSSNPVLKVVEQKTIDNEKELREYFNQVIARGLEGIMAKNPNSEYKAGKRGFHWMKYKPSYEGSRLTDTIDAVILGYYEGKGKRTSFGFGGLLTGVYDEDEDMFKSIARVGTGFSEEQMSKLKKQLDKLRVKQKPARVDTEIEPDHWVEPKYVVTLTADEITKSPIHTAGKNKGKGYALRFPRLVSDGIRFDKSAEEATTVNEIITIYKQQH